VPQLARPDGASIYYEARGDGPLVVFSLGFAALPVAYGPMVEDLARDHRVVLWHPRGYGQSPLSPPHSLSVDSEDFAALVTELGGDARVFAAGHGINVVARAHAAAPGAVRSTVAHGITTALLDDMEGADGLGSSRSVAEMLAGQLRNDPRAAVRSMVTGLNPQLDEEGLRERMEQTLEYMNVEATLERIDAWFGDSSVLPELLDLRDRLVVLTYRSDSWQEAALDDVAELLPDARVEMLDDGPLSRPDLSAQLVRELP
jgi:pimeloyl-ACP methyl ester carboxylesterase